MHRSLRTLRWNITAQIVAVLAGNILAAFISVGQEIDPNAVREEYLPKFWDRKIAVLEYVPSPEKRAQHLLDHYDLVALGEFLPISEPGADYLHARMLTAKFRVDEIFKGPDGAGTIGVELMSDMLEFPGEGISRYEKRAKLREALIAAREHYLTAVQALEAEKRYDAIDETEYRRRKRALEREEREWSEIADALDTRSVNAIHDKTFYDFGGVIKPNQKFLIALPKGSGVSGRYALDETSTNVFWSDTRDEIVAALRSLKRN